MTQARDLADGKFDTDTLVVDAANNRVGVNVASPTKTLDLNAGAVGNIATLTDGVATNFTFKTNSSNVGTFGTEAGSTHLAFMASGSEKGRFLSGGGLTFNGDTAAANALDDYEEGTWTPSYGGGLTASAYNQQDGRYTKVGNLVHVQFTIDASASTTSASDVQITGFPFSTHASQPRAGLTFGANNNWAPNDAMALMNQNNTVMVFVQHNGTALLGTELTTPNAMITITGTYIAA